MFRTLLIACLLMAGIYLPDRTTAQPIGSWTDHLPYSQAVQVVESMDKIWCATSLSLFSIDKDENSIDRWSKVNGLSETGVSCIAAQSGSSLIVVAYRNSNIDVLNNGIVKNISALKNSQLPGNKTVSHILIQQNLAYLSTAFGIVTLDLSRLEVNDTYIIGSGGNRTRVFQTVRSNDWLYAATTEGLKRCDLSTSNPSDYRSWELVSGQSGLPAGPADQVTTINNQLLTLIRDSLYLQNGNNWSLLFTNGKKIDNITSSNNRILVAQKGVAPAILSLTVGGQVDQTLQDPQYIRYPRQAILVGTRYWIADSLSGLSVFNGNSFTSYVPNSPYSITKGALAITPGLLLATSGELTGNGQPANNRNGFTLKIDNNWQNYTPRNLPALDSLPDLVAAAISPDGTSYWLGSFGGGLMQVAGNNVTVYKQNTVFQSSGSYQISGLAFDSQQQLWVTNYGGNPSLQVRKTDGSWKSFAVPFPIQNNAVGSILVDDYDQLWIQTFFAQGLLVYSPGSAIDNPSDDRWRWLRTGTGNGNLPDNTVNCVVKDKNGLIWIGTQQGIGIIPCTQEVFGNNACDAILPVVQQDNFAGYLFRDEQVQCMAVDGANRKWVGTKNGVWLISADGDKTIERFNVSNSPLPDNDVIRIAIDGKTGEVYFATAKGMVSWKGTATEGGTQNQDVLVFPNPVPPGYNGSIAIRGLVNNAIVKITETDGRLVYQTRALGGQAVWNGRNYKGQLISSGVYLVFVSTDDKKEKMVTKIVYIKK